MSQGASKFAIPALATAATIASMGAAAPAAAPAAAALEAGATAAGTAGAAAGAGAAGAGLGGLASGLAIDAGLAPASMVAAAPLVETGLGAATAAGAGAAGANLGNFASALGTSTTPIASGGGLANTLGNISKGAGLIGGIASQFAEQPGAPQQGYPMRGISDIRTLGSPFYQ